MHYRSFLIALASAALLFCTAASRAQTNAPSIPPNSIAWWRFDPTGFDSQRQAAAERAAMTIMLRALVASGVVDKDSTAAIVEGLLAASEVGAAPHTLCVLDFAADRPPDGDGMDIHRLQMVLELQTKGDHTAHLRTLKAILIDAERSRDERDNAGHGAQRALKLPAGVKGVAYREPDWEEWREVSWASTENTFLVGLGRGSLERWLEFRAVKPTPANNHKPLWRAHQNITAHNTDHGETFFEAYLEIDGLRRGFPEAFSVGRAQRIFAALKLDNARDFMLHGRWVRQQNADAAALIALDATWSSRADKPGSVRRIAVSEPAWPDRQLALPPPPGSYAIAMRVDWTDWLNVTFNLIEAFGRDPDLQERRDTINQWRRRNGAKLRRFTARLKPWLVLSDSPAPIAAIPGLTTLYVEHWPAANQQASASDLDSLISDYTEVLARDVSTGIRYLKLEPTGLIRAPAWGFATFHNTPLLIGGWSPIVVTQNRQWLATMENAP